MDVKTVCLGMLTDGPASGYDLKKCFESSFAHFFPAGYGSIYPALAALAADGLVTCEHFPQEGKPDRKVYSITDAGTGQLLRALEYPNPSHKVRSEFLAMMWFAHLMTAEQIDTVIENRLEELDRYIRMFDELKQNDVETWPVGARFVAGFGEAVTKTIKRYIQENRGRLTQEESPEAKSATG